MTTPKELDVLVRPLSAKWGTGRLPMLVNADLRARFRRQGELLFRARVLASAEDIAIQTAGLYRAWVALDKAAEAAGAQGPTIIANACGVNTDVVVAFVF